MFPHHLSELGQLEFVRQKLTAVELNEHGEPVPKDNGDLIAKLEQQVEKAREKARGIEKGTLVLVTGMASRSDLNGRLAVAYGLPPREVSDRESIKMIVGGECVWARRARLEIVRDKETLIYYAEQYDMKNDEFQAAKEVLKTHKVRDYTLTADKCKEELAREGYDTTDMDSNPQLLALFCQRMSEKAACM